MNKSENKSNSEDTKPLLGVEVIVELNNYTIKVVTVKRHGKVISLSPEEFAAIGKFWDRCITVYDENTLIKEKILFKKTTP